MNDNDFSSMYPSIIVYDPNRKLPKSTFKPAGRVSRFFYAHPKIAEGLAKVWRPIGRGLFYLLLPVWWVLARTWLKEDAAFILQNVYWLFEEPWKL